MVWLAVNSFWHCLTCWLLENVTYLHDKIAERPMYGTGAVFRDTDSMLIMTNSLNLYSV